MNILQINPNLQVIKAAFDKADVPIRLVGGCVRDLLLDITPKDYDLTTPATPDVISHILSMSNIENFDMSNGHGTITAMVNHEPFEITTLRIDSDHDGRHATVTFTDDWKADAERRDFTFNAMSMDFDGTLYDYFDGLEDLNNQIVRFVGDAEQRIKEDYLRILRMYRFLGRFEYAMPAIGTGSAIIRTAEGLKKISGERIWSEMSKILVCDSWPLILTHMADVNVLENIDLFIRADGIKTPAACNDPAAMLGWVVEKDKLIMSVARWKMSLKDRDMAWFIARKRDNIETIDYWKAAVVQGLNREQASVLIGMQGMDYKDEFDAWEMPKCPVTGYDLIDRGFKPGRELGRVMAEVKDKWIASDYTLTKEELLD